MNLLSIVLAVLGITATVGIGWAYFRASAGKANRELLESNIVAYQDAIKLKEQRIAYLEGQVYSKDQTIEKLSRLK